MSQKTLYLHIGGGKTGTSFLQSIFARNIDVLRSCGIDYWQDASITEAAAGKISSGNGYLLLQSLWDHWNHQWTSANTANSVLFSSEFLLPFLSGRLADTPESAELLHSWLKGWVEFDDAKRIDILSDWAKQEDFREIKLLLFIRNPVSHCESCYQQAVKRGGETGTADTYAEGYSDECVYNFLQTMQSRVHMKLTVYNYSVMSRRLLELTADWLNLDASLFKPLEYPRVNRSMTLAELALQRHLNARLGICGHLLSDLFCNALPDVRSEKAIPSTAAQVAMWNRLKPAINNANALLDPSQHYSFDQAEPAEDSDRYTFSEDQLRLIAEGLGGEILRLRSDIETAQLQFHDQQQLSAGHHQQLEKLLLEKHTAFVRERTETSAKLEKEKAKCSTLKSKLELQRHALKEAQKELKTFKSRKAPWHEMVFSGERWAKRVRRVFGKMK